MIGAVQVFIAGIIGVFLGMAFLYFSIKLTGAAATALEARGADKGKGDK